MNNDLLFLTAGESFSVFSVSEGKPEGMNISGDLLSRSSSDSSACHTAFLLNSL